MEPMRVNRMQIFDDEVAALRTHVERYIDRGYFETDRRVRGGIINREGVASGICMAIAKQLGRPFVSILIDHTGGAWLAMPAKDDLKHLRTPIIIMGQEGYATFGVPVSYQMQKTVFNAYFSVGAGMRMLEQWKDLIENDRACRFALKLPPRVT